MTHRRIWCGVRPGSEMLKQLADTANFMNRVASGKAEYARASPDGPDHWSTYVDKTRAMWSKSACGISAAKLADIELLPPATPTVIMALLTALDQKFCNHGQRIWTREVAAGQWRAARLGAERGRALGGLDASPRPRGGVACSR